MEHVAQAGRGSATASASGRYKNFCTYCAVVAEVEGEADIRVRRLVVAVDVGEVINPTASPTKWKAAPSRLPAGR
jgi:CO/xanthine dehydrogenase Mo-binding subunit